MSETTFILDLTNYKDRVGSRVDPGIYTVVVDDVEPDKSKAGNPMINVWFRVVGGDFNGATITDRLVLTEKSLFRVVGFMQAIGLPTPKKRLRVNMAQFTGKTLRIEVEDGEPYNGRVKSEVRGYMRVAAGAGAAATEGVSDLDDVASEADAEPQTPEPLSVVQDAEEAASTPAPGASSQADVQAEGEVEPIDLDTLDLG